MNIGIVILATNTYFPLGIRFIKKFMYYYRGNANITFYYFSNIDPTKYVQDSIDIEYFYAENKNWVDGTNLKFNSIISIDNRLKSDYLFYFDADTNICADFDESWFIGDVVAGQHFGDENWMKDNKHFDRTQGYNAYVPYDTDLPQMYYYGAFFGGLSDKCIEICRILRKYQSEDQERGFEPNWNDESYINKYFHYNPPSRVVMSKDFKFLVSDKGGIDTRYVNSDISEYLSDLLKYKNDYINIAYNKVELIPT